MNTEIDFKNLSDELGHKLSVLGDVGTQVKFVFEGMGVLHCDATTSEVVVCNEDKDAEITVSGPLDIWMKIRSKQMAPHVALMTRRLKLEGNIGKAMSLAPRLVAIL